MISSVSKIPVWCNAHTVMSTNRIPLTAPERRPPHWFSWRRMGSLKVCPTNQITGRSARESNAKHKTKITVERSSCTGPCRTVSTTPKLNVRSSAPVKILAGTLREVSSSSILFRTNSLSMVEMAFCISSTGAENSVSSPASVRCCSTAMWVAGRITCSPWLVPSLP